MCMYRSVLGCYIQYTQRSLVLCLRPLSASAVHGGLHGLVPPREQRSAPPPPLARESVFSGEGSTAAVAGVVKGCISLCWVMMIYMCLSVCAL